MYLDMKMRITDSSIPGFTVCFATATTTDIEWRDKPSGTLDLDETFSKRI
jgi:hypothetical protein